MLELRKIPILPQGRKWGLLIVVLRSFVSAVEDEKRKATRVFSLMSVFFGYKDQGERNVITVLRKYS